MQQFRGKNRRNVFSSFFLYSGRLSECLPNFSSVTSKAITYKRYKNASLSKILLIDYHSSQTQWNSVLLFISWAAVGGNIFLKVSTILFSFQIHSQGFFSNTQLLLCLSRFLVLSPVFMHSFSARLAQLRLWNPLCWVSLALTWSSFPRKTPSLIDFFQSFCMKKNTVHLFFD